MHNTRVRLRISALAAACAALSPPLALGAQEPTAGALEEIVVTAQKREESLDRVPITIDAFSGEDLASAGLKNTFDLQFVTPGLSIVPNQSEGQIFIRGVGSNLIGVGNDPSTAAYVDGVYQARSPLLLTRMYDIDRVEVLKGPQGTLYGRNATGGAINIITRAPEAESGGYLAVTGGDYGLRGAEGAVNVPFAGGALRLAATRAVSDGYVENLTGDDLEAVDFGAARARLLVGDTDGWHAVLGVETVRDNGSRGFSIAGIPAYGGSYFNDFGPVYQNTPLKVSVDERMGAKREADSATLQVEGDIGGLGFRSITGYAKLDLDEVVDTDGVSEDIELLPDINKARQYSQEFQLYSQGDSSFSWIAGVYYLRAEQDELWTFQYLPADYSVSDDRFADTDAYAAYVQGSYSFSPEWTLTLGARYSDESKKAGAGDARGQKDFSDFSPKIALEYTPSDNVLVYASIQKGFKSGGFNTVFTAQPFEPEEIIAYEAGAKITALDQRLRVASSLFYYDYTDLQTLTSVFESSTTFQTLVQNAGKAEIHGWDFSAEGVLGAGFTAFLNFELLDTEYQDFVFVDDPFTPENSINLKGNRIPQAPERSGTAGVEWSSGQTGMGEFSARVEYAYQSSIFFGVENTPIESRDSVGLWNANLNYLSTGEQWSGNVAFRNISDETYALNVLDYLSCCNVLGVSGAPRTVEVSVQYSF